MSDGYDYVHDGKTYHVGLITEGIQWEFARKVFEAEKRRLKEVQDLLTPAAYQAKADALADRRLKGGFSMLQEGKQNPLADPQHANENGMILFALMMGISQVEIIALLSVKKVREELMPLIHEAMRDTFPGMSPKAGDPTPETPEETQKKTT